MVQAHQDEHREHPRSKPIPMDQQEAQDARNYVYADAIAKPLKPVLMTL